MEAYIPAIVAIIGAGLSSYMGVRIAITEIKSKIKSHDKELDRHRKELDWLRDKVT